MDLFEFKVNTVKEIEKDVQKLIIECQKLLTTIECTGIESHFSINTEITRHADNIRKRLTLLGYINTFNLKINEGDCYGS